MNTTKTIEPDRRNYIAKQPSGQMTMYTWDNPAGKAEGMEFVTTVASTDAFAMQVTGEDGITYQGKLNWDVAPI